MEIKCKTCGKIFQSTLQGYTRSKNHFCSRACFGRSRIKGRKINTAGYVLIYKPDHPRAKQNYVLKSRLVMEGHLGRYLEPDEIIHHRGTKYPIGNIENKQDDRLENLEILSKSKHDSFHLFKRIYNGHTITCCVCGKIVKRNPSQEKRKRRQVCSIKCRTKLPKKKRQGKDTAPGKQHYKCSACGKKFTQYISTKNCKNHYCSPKCKYSTFKRNKIGQFI